MSKNTVTPIIRVAYTTNTYTDFVTNCKSDAAILMRQITTAINEHKAVKLCDNIIINTNNIIYVEVL